jgi:pentatricopeptide repeat protein
VVTYSSLIDGLSRSLRHRQAERLWSQMHAVGIQPDSRSYTIAVHMYCRMHRLSDARRSIAEMTARKLTPSAATYSPLFTLFGKDKDFEGLLELLSEMHAQNVAIDERAFQSILSAAAAMGLLNVVKAMSVEASAATATAAAAAVKAQAAAVDAAARQDMPLVGKREVAVTWSGDRIRQILEGACIETRERRPCESERERQRGREIESHCGKRPSPVKATLKEAGPEGVGGCIDGGDDVTAPARPAVEETETSKESRALIKRHGGSVDVTRAVGGGGSHALGGGSSSRGDGDGVIRVNVFHDEGGERERVVGAGIRGTSSEIALYGRRSEVESARAVFDAAQKSGRAGVHEYTGMMPSATSV